MKKVLALLLASLALTRRLMLAVIRFQLSSWIVIVFGVGGILIKPFLVCLVVQKHVVQDAAAAAASKP